MLIGFLIFKFYFDYMKQIYIDDDIGEDFFGFGISDKTIRSQLEEMSEFDDLEIIINSAGGSVFTGIAIFNLIRDFASERNVSVEIQGMAASIASYIALAAKIANPKSKIKVHDNSVFFIHNARTFAEGDANELKKQAEICERLSNLLCDSAYAKVSTDSPKAIHKAMDKETFYIGKEIIEHGYADELIQDDEKMDSDLLVAKCESAYSNAMSKIEDFYKKNSEARKISAKIADGFFLIENKKTDSSKEDENMKMTLDEFKAKEPELYKEVLNQSVTNTVTEERERVVGLLNEFKEAGDVNAALDFIQNGKTMADKDVRDAWKNACLASKTISDRKADEPPAIHLPQAENTLSNRGAESANETANRILAKLGVK